MNESLRHYMDDIFASAPQSRKANELKEELLGNMNEKYHDLLEQGCSEEEAYKQVITGIGDVNELILNLQRSPLDPLSYQAERKKNALIVSLCVGLYIIAFIVAIIVEEVFGHEAGAALTMFGISTVPTCILVFHFLSRPKYESEEKTIVEEYKEKKSAEQHRNNITGSLSAILWSLIVAVYFIMSFSLSNWHISWILFIVGAALNQAIKLIIDLRAPGGASVTSETQRKSLLHSIVGLIWTVTVIIYLLISFLFFNWHISWVIFLIAAAVTSGVRLLFNLKN